MPRNPNTGHLKYSRGSETLIFREDNISTRALALLVRHRLLAGSFFYIYDSTSSVDTELDRRAKGMVLTPSVTYCAVCWHKHRIDIYLWNWCQLLRSMLLLMVLANHLTNTHFVKATGLLHIIIEQVCYSAVRVGMSLLQPISVNYFTLALLK